MNDLKFAFRQLLKNRGFTAVAVLMLAIGIGSVTTMFGMVRAMVVRPYSSPNGDRLVQLWSSELKPLSTPDYLDIHNQAVSFAELGVYAPATFNVGGGEHPVSARGALCTPGVLRAFGVAPALGRWLDDEDEQTGAAPAAVISYRLWQESFGGDRALIWRALRLDDEEVTVVGVMPAGFEFNWLWMGNDTCQVWRSFRLQRDQPSQWNWCAVGLLKQGVTLAPADAEIKAIGARLKAARGEVDAGKPFLVTSLRRELTRYVSSYVWMLVAATLLVLAVACANLASMLLARSVRRQGEFGVRLALGASPSQILRLAFSETFLLALGGVLLSAPLASVELSFLRSLAPPDFPRGSAMVLDGQAFIFAAGLSLLTGLLAGFLPAVGAKRISVGDFLRADNRGATRSIMGRRLLRGLIVAQVAVAFILANVAVLLSASYAKMIASNAGIVNNHVLSAELNLRAARYNTNGSLTRFSAQLAAGAAAIPGVAAAGIVTDLPLEWGPGANVLVDGEVFDPEAQRPAIVFSAITPGYFAAADIPIVQGRTLEFSDAGWGEIGIVVNRAFVERYWPGQNALGKIVRPNAPNPWFHARVVGVVENVRQWGIRSEPQPQLYWTIDHAWGNTIFLVVRSSQAGTALAPALRRAVGELDPDIPLSRVRTFKTIVHQATLLDKIVAGSANCCTMAAIALAAIGLYGTLSYLVLHRTREIGVRMALGGTRGDILRLVIRQGFAWVLPGIVVGISGAVASANVLRALVYEVNPINPVALSAAAGAVVLAAALACWFPARRAAGTNPMEALHCE